jgi:hypothetical protein
MGAGTIKTLYSCRKRKQVCDALRKIPGQVIPEGAGRVTDDEAYLLKIREMYVQRKNADSVILRMRNGRDDLKNLLISYREFIGLGSYTMV